MINTPRHLSNPPTVDSTVDAPVNPLQSYFFFFLVMVLLLSMVCDAPVRYLLFNYGMQQLIYVRELIIIIIVLLYVSRSIFLGMFPIILAYLFIIFVFHSIIGYYYIENSLMIAFGWRIFLPMVFGIIFYQIGSLRMTSVIRYFTIFLVIGLAGIFINYFIDFPWEGLQYNVGSYVIEGVKEGKGWGLGEEVKRIAGFSRSSHDAAIQVTMFAIFVVPNLKYSWAKVILWLVLPLAIVITNTKGLLVTYACLSIILIIYWALPNHRKLYRRILLGSIIIACALPFLYDIFGLNKMSDFTLYVWIKSFLIRAEQFWPDAIQQLSDKGNFILGRGMGGIGASQLFFEPNDYNSVDNIFVYAYIYFGLFSLVYFYYIYAKSKIINYNNDFFYYLILLAVFIYGMIQSVVENGIINFFFGMALGYITENKKISQLRPMGSPVLRSRMQEASLS
jgi:hypothetical protein